MRVIAATNRNLVDMVARGTFREDLYYRLNVFPLALPPLRARTEDIEGLVLHLAAKQGRAVAVSPDALRCLCAYAWPGNVRELENVVERAYVTRTLVETEWVIEGDRGAARRLGLHPNTLRSRLKRWGIKRPHLEVLAAS